MGYEDYYVSKETMHESSIQTLESRVWITRLGNKTPIGY